MAWSNSKIFSAFVTDVMNNTTAMDMNSDTLNVALYGVNTPDQTVASASSAYNTGQWITGNELSNGGWIAGGLALASVTSTFTTNVYTLDAADRVGGATDTLTAVFGCLVFDFTIAAPVAKQGMSFNYFGGSQSVTSGSFTVVWNTSGILTLTL